MSTKVFARLIGISAGSEALFVLLLAFLEDGCHCMPAGGRVANNPHSLSIFARSTVCMTMIRTISGLVAIVSTYDSCFVATRWLPPKLFARKNGVEC
jgi:hypothetical protein